MKRLIMAGVLVLLAAADAARADVVPVCPAPAGVTEVPFDQLPAAVQKALHDKTLGLAMPGQPFNDSDAVTKSLPSSRGIFAWTRGRRWVVATERGGRSYYDPIYVFDKGADGKHLALTSSRTAFPATVCAVAKALIDAQ